MKGIEKRIWEMRGLLVDTRDALREAGSCQ
jgi:hypothetical protein